MANKLVLTALGGFGVGFAALILAVNAAAPKGGLTGSSTYCTNAVEPGVDPTATERTWTWEGGDSIVIGVAGNVRYRGGEGDKVIVTGDPELVSRVRVRGDTIDLPCNGRINKGVEVTLPGRAFRSFRFTGSGNVQMENIKQAAMDMSLDGNGAIRMSGSVDDLNVQLRGSGKVTFAGMTSKDLGLTLPGSGQIDGKGSAEKVVAKVNGSGTIELQDIPMREIKASIPGSGVISAAPKDKADVDISGSGVVTFYTRPPQVNSHISGSGNVNYRTPG